MSSVKVIIPLYRAELSELELQLLEHNLRVLHQREILFLMPEGLEFTLIDTSKYEVVRVSDEWLGRKRGIAGYNRMMMSEEFYALFSDVEYILICQTDVYLFRDDLDEWIERGYDYVGAPWIRRKSYNNPIIRLYLALRMAIHRGMGRRGLLRQELFDKVGNGGLSLRCVDSARRACVAYRERIDEMLATKGHLGHEDVFWAVVPREFRYPEWREALTFSVDKNPTLSLSYLPDGELPMGCHGLTNPKIMAQWRGRGVFQSPLRR